MKKLSNITESVWADIHRRSNGSQERKEDDIDLLDRDGMYDYLISHYKRTNSFASIYNSETYDTIKVPFLIWGGADYVYLDFKKNEVSIPYSSPYKVNGLFSKLENEFSLKSDAKGHTWYIISPKDGSKVTNTFYIYVIDFLIDNISDSFVGVEKIVTESVWADIHRRSNGKQERKEDMLNDSWDLGGMYDYICTHYKSISDEPIEDMVLKSTWALTVPLFHHNGDIYLSLKPHETYKLIVCSYTVRSIKPFFGELCKKYTVKTIMNSGSSWYEIYPKGLDHNSITNTFFIELIDYFLTFDGNGINKLEKLIEKK